jgi:hypothetical protein
MADEEKNELSPEELEQQEAEPLPDREVMSLLGGPIDGRFTVEYPNLPPPEDAA